jgi:hypothetical protein
MANEPIKLVDGTELVALEPEEKQKLEEEIKAVLDKYKALYLPVIKEENSITTLTKTAGLLLLKRKEAPVQSPYNKEDGTEETPKVD